MTPTYFAEPSAFRAWLAANSGSATELLVGFYKVGSEHPCMSWPESVDEALCFGWIDGRRKRIDDERYVIRFTPRKATSTWSAANIAKMDKLRFDGRMLPAGEAAFALRSEARSGIHDERTATPELSSVELALFQRDGVAWDYFDAAAPGYRKTVLHWIAGAIRDKTRAARLARLMAACAARKRLT